MAKSLSPHLLVLGGANSGKSAYAEGRANQTGLGRVYIATAQAFDAEMSEKIARHQDQRGAGWTTLEAPFDVPGALDSRTKGEVVLLDCATLWLSNHLLAEGDLEAECDALLAAAAACPAHLIIVSNEVGLGLVPETPLGRRFRTAQGRLNQALAAQAGEVVFVAAGLPLWLKSPAA